MEEHFKETLNRAVATEPPVLDAWDRFEQRAGRGRRVSWLAAIAAAAAVAVASVIVVPRLGTSGGIGLSTEPPAPSPTPTLDPYAGWKSYEYDLYDFRLRHPGDWRVVVFEANPEVLAPGQIATAAGEPTMAVTLALFDKEAYDPGWEEFSFARGTRPDGRTFLRHITEPLDGGGKRIEYSIDWSTCLRPTSTSSCVRRTLFVAIHIGTDALGDTYGDTAEKIVNSIEYTGAAG